MPAIRFGSGNTSFNTPASFDPGAMDFYGTMVYDALYHAPVGTYGMFGGPEGGVQRAAELGIEKNFGSGSMLDPEEAQEKYGLDGALTFDEPIYDSAAKLLHDRKLAEHRREYLLSSGFQHGGLIRKGMGFGTGMAASAIDPVNLASMFIPVVGQSKLMSGAKGASGMMSTLELARIVGTNRTRLRLAAGAVEGLTGMAMVEPLVLFPAIYEQSNYTAADSANNLAAGVFLGAGLHFSFGKMSDAFSGLSKQLNPLEGYGFDPDTNFEFKRVNPETDAAAFRSTISQVVQDEPVTAPNEVFATDEQMVWRDLKSDIIERSLPEIGEFQLRQSRLGYELLVEQLSKDVSVSKGWDAKEARAEAVKELGPDFESKIQRELQDLPTEPIKLSDTDGLLLKDRAKQASIEFAEKFEVEFENLGMDGGNHPLQDILSDLAYEADFTNSIKRLGLMGIDPMKAEVRLGGESLVFIVDNTVIKFNYNDSPVNIKGVTSKEKASFNSKYFRVSISEKVKPLLDEPKSSGTELNKAVDEAFNVFGEIYGYSFDDAYAHNIGINSEGKVVLFDNGNIQTQSLPRENVIKAIVKSKKLKGKAKEIFDAIEAQHKQALALDPEYDAKLVKKEIQKRVKALVDKKRREAKSAEKRLDSLPEIPKARETQLLGSPVKETPDAVEIQTPETIKKSTADIKSQAQEMENAIDPESLTPEELKTLDDANLLNKKADALSKAMKKGAACVTAKAL